jgi:hypothetical protein
MRAPRATAALLAAATGIALAACAESPPAAPGPTATHSREVASDSRCLADHSPWTVDLEAVFAEWRDAVGATRELQGGTISGTAELSFTRGDSSTWTFTASGVSFELYFADGTRETTTLARELTGSYALPEPGGLLELSTLRVIAAATDAVTTDESGARSEGTSVAAPRFPWDAEAGTTLAVTCTEHRLVVSAPGETPDAWDLSPG